MQGIYTPIQDTDIYTLYQLNDCDLYHACLVNKQTYQLCQNNPTLKHKLDRYLKRYNYNVLHRRNERQSRYLQFDNNQYYAYESSDENDSDIDDMSSRYGTNDKYKYANSEEEVEALDFLDQDLNTYYNTHLNYTLPLRTFHEDYYDIDEYVPYKQTMTKQELDKELDDIAATIAHYI
jgi:hypothetical protein